MKRLFLLMLFSILCLLVSAQTIYVKTYVQEYKQIAVNIQNTYGIPASILFANALVKLTQNPKLKSINNHFGIKCFSTKCHKGHCTNINGGKEFYIIYRSPSDNYKNIANVFTTGKYAYLKKYGMDYRRWAFGLQAVKYSNDPDYAEKLIGVIQRYDLDRFD